jgi:hypothetical protein
MLLCESGRAGAVGGGGGQAKSPLANVVDDPVSIDAHPLRDKRCSSRRSFLPSLGFSSTSRAGKGRKFMLQTVYGWRSGRRARISHVPGPSPFVSDTCLIAKNPPVPSPSGLRCQGAAFLSSVPLRWPLSHYIRQPIDNWLPIGGGVGRSCRSRRRYSKCFGY